ncbi:hypothetical protein GMD78_10770 [Ornithinibacillus sp. L9]|uniref:Uncharacterized protein n=1 Tax=Ornithinibacillus caprae TaxID=2678566 RepID=A0A6N8FHF4_9BACI|nr:hypothetical protein [Ornithinibacillus caprae]MUK88875.1 hypothetical protein [Ornithinibacillus caprae]
MTPAISLWESYMVETLLAKGMSSSTLISYLQNEDSKALNDFDDTFDYAELIQASNKANATIIEAIQSDYRIKYVSKFGIKKLLDLKFSLQEGTNYRMEDAKFYDIPLNEDQLETLEKMFEPHWKFINKRQTESGYLVDLLHVTELE